MLAARYSRGNEEVRYVMSALVTRHSMSEYVSRAIYSIAIKL